MQYGGQSEANGTRCPTLAAFFADTSEWGDVLLTWLTLQAIIRMLAARIFKNMFSSRQKDPEEQGPTAPLDSSPAAARDEANRLADVLYPELKRIARARMRGERADHTLQPTALVNELYLQLLQRSDVQWTSREHFLLSASKAMSHLLVDHARARSADKRGGGWIRWEFDELATGGSCDASLSAVEVDDLLSRLAAKEPRMAEIVRLKFFLGLNTGEIGKILDIDERTVKRDWALAREWLRGHLRSG
jgi:RNA polymerase sigma factor (TIGR02999 family)